MGMKPYRKIIATMALILLGGVCNEVAAKAKCTKIYAYGFSASFNDSIVYFTDIQEIDSAWINEKNKFLISRENYSFQLKNYFNGLGQEHRTCVISYALERKDIEKKYQKMKNKYVKAGNFSIKYIDSNDFSFKAIKPDDYELNQLK